jgi:DNA-binding winged helix-turn-helix (wHTH) protein/tetratricopeptide (TPR) repeat protein
VADRTYRFGDFELSEPLFELRRRGTPVPVQPKVLDLLLHLVRDRDRVVSKAELLAALWRDVVVTEASLSKAVSAARRALGDGADEQRHIRTVRGRGFRFVAAVEERAEGGPAPEAAAPTGDDFVGREDVLGAVRTALAAARDGAGQLVLLAGEAGIGKTRTAHEGAARARRDGVRVLRGWCPEGEGSPALWPWLQPLRHLLDEGEPGSLLDGLGEGVADLAELVPTLSGHVRVVASRARLDPAQARFRLFETITRVLRRAARTETLLLVLDDLHWADRGSLALLGFLTRELAGARLVLLGTFREEDLARGHPLLEIGRQPGATVLRLPGLARDEVARLVAHETGERVDDAVAAAIHERTEGNPFFVKELARALQASGGLDGVATLATLPLPTGVRETLRSRLERLSPGCRAALVPAALLGMDLDVGLLARVTGLGPERLVDHLDEARAARVLLDRTDRARFAHALVREALLEPLAARARAALHRSIGEALEAHLGADLEPHLSRLAHHFCAGATSGGVERALDYARRAGERAARLLASDEAAAHYARALEMHALLAVGDERLRCELLLALGEAQVGAGEPQAGRETLRRAAAVARRLSSAEHLARAALAMGGPPFSLEVGVEDPELLELLEEALKGLPADAGALRVRLLVRRAIALAWGHAWGEVGDVLAEALESARRLGDAPALGHALYCHRWTLLPPGELEAKLADSDEILRLARESRDRELELAARSCRFLDLVELGRLDDADRELALYERVVSVVRVPRYRWRARFYRAMRLLLDGRFAEAESLVFEALGEERRFMPGDTGQVFAAQLTLLRREQGRAPELEPALREGMDRFPTLPTWRAALALLHADMGRLDDARDGFEAYAADDFRGLPKGLNWTFGLAVLAEVCAALGDAARAARLHELLHPSAPRTVVLGAGVACLGAVDRFLGLLAGTRGAWDAAARHFEAALQTNTRIGARPWVGWTEHDWAWMLCARGRPGDRDAAARHLGRARAVAQSLGMVRLAERSAALAARLA